MPCIVCMAALGVAAAIVAPALVDSLDDSLRSAAADLRRVHQSGSVVLWSGTFSFEAGDGRTRQAGANIWLYKAAGRVRIQVLTHELAHDDVHRLQDTIARALDARILSRADGRAGKAGPDTGADVTERIKLPERQPEVNAPTPLPPLEG